MKVRRFVVAVSIIVPLLLTACGGNAASEVEEPAPVAEEPAAEEEAAPPEEEAVPAEEEAAPAEEEAAPAEEEAEEGEGPTEFKIAVLAVSTAEDPWSQTAIQSLDRVIEESPRGLDVSYEFVENVTFADVERIGREFAASGEYGLIWFTTNYIDAVLALSAEFPDQLMAISSTAFDEYEPGGNVYWLYSSPIHEASYLCGVVAGLMSESNTIGAVASYPVESINQPVNAYIAGAKSVNPDIHTRVTFIESWYDPATAREAAEAQISAEADVIFGLVFGVFEATLENDVYGIGVYVDQSYLAPESVLTSPIAMWDPRIEYLIDEWWAHEVDGTPYSAPAEKIQFTMAEGGNDIAPLSEELVPDDVAAQVMEVRQQILDGELVIEANVDTPESD